jgi:hypothetical protein
MYVFLGLCYMEELVLRRHMGSRLDLLGVNSYVLTGQIFLLSRPWFSQLPIEPANPFIAVVVTASSFIYGLQLFILCFS